MIRKTLTILSLIGLLLSTGLWVVSYWRFGHQGKHHLIMLCKGGISYDHYKRELPLEPEWLYDGFRSFRTSWSISYSESESASYWGVTVPLWIPTAFLGVILALSSPSVRRRSKRKKLGLCVKCGYDLRESKERCPECNTAFKR